jgi:hypothetical protein
MDEMGVRGCSQSVRENLLLKHNTWGSHDPSQTSFFLLLKPSINTKFVFLENYFCSKLRNPFPFIWVGPTYQWLKASSSLRLRSLFEGLRWGFKGLKKYREIGLRKRIVGAVFFHLIFL